MYRALRHLCLGFLFAVTLTSAPMAACADAPNAPETYSRLRVSLGGNLFTGNLNQLIGNLHAHYGLSTPKAGVDLVLNAFRLWVKPTKEASYKVVGSDVLVTALPHWYVSDRLHLSGFARYESRLNLQLDLRLLAGVGLGYTPARSKNFLARVAIVPLFEHASFADDNFRLPVPNDGGARNLLRIGLLSNGWYRIKGSPVTFRYLFQAFFNPQIARDFRVFLNMSANIHISGPLALRVAAMITHEEAILEGREPDDVRATFGLTLALR